MTEKTPKIRRGKDIDITWAILTDGEPVDLSKRDLKLVLRTPLRTNIALDFAISGNMIIATYPGVDQKLIGIYQLTLWENYDKPRQTVVDKCRAFELVLTTCHEDEEYSGLVHPHLQLTTQQLLEITMQPVKATNEVNI